MITSLALIPINAIEEGSELIKEHCQALDEEVSVFFCYFEDTWLNNPRDIFNRRIWSQHGVIRKRPNNFDEGKHSKINSLMGKSQPNFYDLSEKLMSFQISNMVEFERLINGGDPKPRRRIYVEQNSKIVNLIEMFSLRQISLKSLLVGLSSAIKLNI